MKVLVACEESQTVCKAFRKRGHEAYSCDIQECSGGHNEWHIIQDVIPLLNGDCEFETVDGTKHKIDGKWDLIIAHPPCQKLSCAGAVNLGRKGCACETPEWREKFFNDRTEAAIFFMQFMACNCDKVCVENPVGYMNTHYRKPDQFVEPFQFGDPWKKKTGLWLRGLNPLKPTNIVTPTGKWVQQNRMGQPPKSEAWEVVGFADAKTRSKTFEGIAEAMAEQWGEEDTRHAYWIIENDDKDWENQGEYRLHIKCSKCGKTHFLGTTKCQNEYNKEKLKKLGNYADYSFCGKCGAKMNEE